MESSVKSDSNEPVFELKKWNVVALWAWGKTLYQQLILL
jgi:hypothetical protein